MKTIMQALREHTSSGKNKQAARKAAFTDACYGRAYFNVEDDVDIPSDFISLRLSSPAPNCAWCLEYVEEKDAVVQSGYWTPHSYMMGHKSCRDKKHPIEVWDQQVIDQDCNECKHFAASDEPMQGGSRYGTCTRTKKDTIAYPGGVYCSYPQHEACFEHRKPDPSLLK